MRSVDGFEEELDRHIRGLRRYALSLTGNQTESEDLVQDTLRRALAYAKGDGHVENWRAYLFTVMHNVYVDSAKRRMAAACEVPIDQCQIPEPASQHQRLECLEIARALRTLPADLREVICMVAVDGMLYREVAAVLGIPIGTVMSRLSRARESLRRAVDG
jgi:RNA polymerase sigma-70 factor (ECF subfamily)